MNFQNKMNSVETQINGRTYLMESQVTLDGVGGEKDFTVAGQNQQESIESLWRVMEILETINSSA